MTSKALHSCFLCRRNKRRCDKSLPSCQLCIRKGWKCSYPQRRGQRSASPPRSLDNAEAVNNSNSVIAKPPMPQSGILAGYQTGSSSSRSSFAVNFAISFLAPDIFREGSLEIPRLNLDIPEDVAFHLGDKQKLRETARQFFQITWMPIIGRKRYLNTVLNPLSPLRRPTTLLALCMKLSCLEVLGDRGKQRTSLYQLVKKFYSEVESTEGLCIQVLQAGILIAIFEICDAIYPAAYLTVGACARYGVVMGLDKINQDRMGGDHNYAASWMEIEERRRAWWGVLILDRYLNLANPSRNLATKDPTFEDFLPVDDELFFDATSQPENAVTISQGFVFKIGHFGRLAQATYLISQVLENIRSPSVIPDYLTQGNLSADVAQLCRTIEALVRANEMEITTRRLAFCCQILVSYSGIFLLQQHLWERLNVRSTQEAQQHTFMETRSAIDTLCRIALELQQGSNMVDPLQGQCTFFLVGVVYQGLLALMTIGQGNPSAEISETITTLSWLLEHIRGRWPLAGVYRSILDAKEAILAAEAI
ncbi:hypothetical protein TMatcc_008182 [Talaromyces marneffei ATCC 18224]|uniref:Zn(2)-C6 fungal-type domain-containing protein n=1 Tax=Talaromyces marneffei (strain ATCC 18224 / CBS 334.59 / QM 7333) TaxID=441960 RepID=B6QN71_TALMQ|nr:conserved hypothetical protein [Talaromyces marneffei ATCC 18224]KAE8550181.1 hypothetical protein EYB25_006402 [Talaromyces marneffei]